MDSNKIRKLFPLGVHYIDMSKPPKKVFWNSSDSEMNFNLTVKEMKKHKINWRWANEEIVYDINYNGLRGTETYDENYNFSNTYVVLGCSFVEGIGNRADETISAYIEKKSGIKTLNFGNGGTGCDIIFYNAMWLAGLKNPPRKIFISWPPIQRFSQFHTYVDPVGKDKWFTRAADNSKVIDPFLGTTDITVASYKKYYKPEYVLDPYVHANNKRLWQTLIRSTWGSNVVELDIVDNGPENQTYQDDVKSEIMTGLHHLDVEEFFNDCCARDIRWDGIDLQIRKQGGKKYDFIVSHWGPRKNQNIADWFLSQ